ncbi:PaaX family transcriptional regulator [Nocardioides euryhalodurans]|uniref:PaaX family transcriptional regulator n=1 Tax=Nocardioides euryhalodurans TaxID=2518370 RepID=A0A4P7GP08_9ACTN|nr:PaaX family transcriptional regulator C-terminal domain-containing protein [Nocardioides euryhalodurans]QBR93709.1 PaaX family transcriptional regulator [Nocardioides euryhalodurans]
MHARSALFDVYGDHLRGRGSRAPVAGLVHLLEPVGIQPPAVRTAISRMVAQGWLEPVHLPAGRGYRATDRAIRWLDDAGARVYRRDEQSWDGHWQLALVEPPPDRAARARLRADLAFVGYAEVAPQAWISPYQRAELAEVLQRAGTTARVVRADDISPSPVDAWDLDALDAAYRAFMAYADRLLGGGEQTDDPDRTAFAARFQLVHEWRKFLFTDPGLPAELLPAGWSGHAAAELFTSEATRLKPAADRYVARCLD